MTRGDEGWAETTQDTKIEKNSRDQDREGRMPPDILQLKQQQSKTDVHGVWPGRTQMWCWWWGRTVNDGGRRWRWADRVESKKREGARRYESRIQREGTATLRRGRDT